MAIFSFFDHILAAIVHKSFVLIRLRGRAVIVTFLFSVPCYKPHTQGANWGVKTLIFGLTLEIENCPGVRILMHKIPRHTTCTADTLDK